MRLQSYPKKHGRILRLLGWSLKNSNVTIFYCHQVKLGSTFMVVVAIALFVIYLIERRDNWLLWMSVGLAFAALVLNFQAITLTLPGIAGLILTIGIAVDANVLIFERIREELAAGSPPQSAISSGYDKALSSIADANITTLIAAIVLFAFGTGAIKGFALTLSKFEQ